MTSFPLIAKISGPGAERCKAITSMASRLRKNCVHLHQCDSFCYILGGKKDWTWLSANPAVVAVKTVLREIMVNPNFSIGSAVKLDVTLNRL